MVVKKCIHLLLLTIHRVTEFDSVKVINGCKKLHSSLVVDDSFVSPNFSLLSGWEWLVSHRVVKLINIVSTHKWSLKICDYCFSLLLTLWITNFISWVRKMQFILYGKLFIIKSITHRVILWPGFWRIGNLQLDLKSVKCATYVSWREEFKLCKLKHVH